MTDGLLTRDELIEVGLQALYDAAVAGKLPSTREPLPLRSLTEVVVDAVIQAQSTDDYKHSRGRYVQ
jgi:hypothetical protein